MTKLATFGLLATSGIGQSLAAPVANRDMSPSPHRKLSRIEQDMSRAMELVRRGEDPYAAVDWDRVDYSKTDWSKIDWSKVSYGSGEPTSTPGSPSVYGTPQAMPSSPAIPSPSLSSLGRAYESTFGQPSPLVTPAATASSVIKGFAASPPPLMTAQPVPSGKPSLSIATTFATATTSSTPPPAAPTVQVTAPGNQAVFQAPAAPINFFDGIDAEQNAVAVVWHGDGPITFGFFANAGPYQPNLSEAFESVTLQSGEHQTVKLPHAWSGRVQKMTGPVNSDATWAELTFNGYEDLTWYDDSYIRGYNGPLEMYLADKPDERAGSKIDMRPLFPADKLVAQRGGSAIPAVEGYDGTIRFDVRDFFRAHTKDTAAHKEAYIVHDDDSATRTGSSHHLVTEWY